MAETITLFINEQEERGFAPHTTVQDVLVVLLEGQEGHLFLEDSEEPLAIELTLAEIGIGPRGHVHASRCRHIHVTVDYAGKVAEKSFAPTARVKAVRDWAVAWPKFEIEVAERPKMALFVPDDKVPLKDIVRIGALVEKGECKLSLVLALRERWQG